MSTRPNRETAYRVFAAEFDDATLSYAESDEERAPNYVVTPTGARLNRLFVVGVLTEIESVNDEQLRARIVDPTGAFVVYAGQYQPEALSTLERIETPAFVAVTGKARTFQPEDSNRVFTSIRPETLSEVDAATRDRFAVTAAEHTIERVQTMREARERDERGDALGEVLESDGVEAGLAAGIPRALDHYDTTPAYLAAIEELALDVARVVAGEREEVQPLRVTPDERAPDPTDSGDIRAGTETQSADSADESEAETTVEAGDETASSGDELATEATNEPPVETRDEIDSVPEAGESESSATTDEAAQPGAHGEASESVDDSFDKPDESSGKSESEAADETTIEADLEDPEEFEIEADERERIEAEFGTDFESAAEVDDPGEADIETPALETSDADAEPAGDGERTEAETEAEADAAEATEDDAEPVDPEEAVVAAMLELDDGDGVAREAVVERVVDEHGLTHEAADDGIQSALMSGECYEPDDDTLKPI